MKYNVVYQIHEDRSITIEASDIDGVFNVFQNLPTTALMNGELLDRLATPMDIHESGQEPLDVTNQLVVKLDLI